jgi:exonuclease VII large subunit
MTRSLALLLVCSFLSLTPVTAATDRRSEAPSAAAPAIADSGASGWQDSVDRLTSSMERLVTLLEKQTTLQTVDAKERRIRMVIDVLALRQRKLEQLDTEIRAMLREEEDLKEAIASMETETEAVETRVMGEGLTAEQVEMMKREFASHTKQMKERVERLGSRRQELEATAANDRKRLVGLERQLDDWIDEQQ